MNSLESALSVDNAADQIISLLGADDGADDTVPESQADLEGREDTSLPGEPSDSASERNDNTAAADEASSPIDPPASWKADAKERFKALPHDLQLVIADREREREQHFSKTQAEVAQARRAAEAERAAVQQERQAYADRLGVLIDMTQNADPVLADAAKTDWAKLSQEDPATAQAKWFAYQQRLREVDQLAAHRRQLQSRMAEESFRQADAKLSAELDLWRDPAKRKAFQVDLQEFLVGNGFNDVEVKGISDARAVLLARKAMLYDRLMAQQEKIATVKKTPAPTRVLRTQARGDDDGDPRAGALMKRAAKTGRLDDQAAAVMAKL